MILRNRTCRRALAATTAALFSIAIGGCAAIQDNPRTTRGAVGGAAVGAGTGAAIGAIVGGKKGAGKGAAIGGVVGLLGGTAVGAYLDKQAREMEMVISEQDSLRREQERLTVVMASDVLFAFDSANVAPGARPKISQLGGVLNRYPRSSVQVVGHTDSTGSEEYNLALSQRRATSIANELITAGVSPNRISTRGYGESMPVASNANEAGRQQNRRVEIVVDPDENVGAEPAGGY